MTVEETEVCVIGLGAVGGTVAAAFAHAGANVSALARGETLRVVDRDGLTLVQEGKSRSLRLTVSDSCADLPRPHLIVLSVKAMDLPAIATTVADLRGPDTVVLSMTNGIPWWFFDGLSCHHKLASLNEPAMDSIPRSAILGSVAKFSAFRRAPGVVQLGQPARVIVGEPKGGSSPRVVDVVDLMRLGGIRAQVSDFIQRDVWAKLWGNMTANPISALTGATLDRLTDDDLVGAFMLRCMDEASAIGLKIGVPALQSPEERLEGTRRVGRQKTSMLQDVEAGRPVEIDALLTSITELGRRVGLATPDLDTLLGLTRLHARLRGLYPE
jgi:2-dehydropantoate 2-reductase